MHSSISSFHSPSLSLIIIFIIQSWFFFFTLFFYSIPLHSNTKRPVEPAIGLVCKVGIKPLFHYVKLSTYVCHTWHEKAGNYWNINLPVYTRTYILCIYSLYTVSMYTPIMQIAFSTYLHMKLKGLVGFYIVFIAQNRHAHPVPLPHPFSVFKN